MGIPSPEGKVVTKVNSGDYWIYEPHRFILSRVHKRVRNALFDPESTKDCPVDCNMLGRSRTTIIYGMFDVDYQIESTEIREAVTDWDYVGDERIGSASISLFGPKCLRGVFVEDNPFWDLPLWAFNSARLQRRSRPDLLRPSLRQTDARACRTPAQERQGLRG